jgi:catechol 2,3-dioxygenase-like lactoylglutathione lyase family enzyme
VIDHLAFHAENRADVDGVYGLLVEAGYEVADLPAEYDSTPGDYAVAFDDPDGIRLEVVHEPITNP